MYDTLAALDRATVDEVLDKYSWLAKSDDSFLEEFKRIEDIGIAKEVLHFLDRYYNAIRTLCKPKIKDSESLLQGLHSLKCSDAEKYCAACLAIFGVMLLSSKKVWPQK